MQATCQTQEHVFLIIMPTACFSNMWSMAGQTHLGFGVRGSTKGGYGPGFSLIKSLTRQGLD
jgi:hypothetical protein